MNDPASVATEQLKSIVERVERLEAEKAGLLSDIKDVYAEAKGTGFDVKAIRKIVRLRKMDHAKRQEEEAVLELYMMALGMLGDTPLGQAAMRRDLGSKVVDTATQRAASSPSFRAAVKGLGKQVAMSPAERAAGGIGTFQRGNVRMSICVPGHQTDIEDAIAGRA